MPQLLLIRPMKLTSKYLVIDFETRSRTELSSAGAYAYAEDSSTEVTCLGITDETGHSWVWIPDNIKVEGFEAMLDYPTITKASLISKINKADLIIAHNMEFDRAIWNYCAVLKYKLPFLELDKCVDTMAMVHSRALPGSLENAAKHLALGVAKDMGGRAVMLKTCKPNRNGDFVMTADDLAILCNYCCVDTIVCEMLYRKFPPLNHDIWALNQRINNNGIAIDNDLIKRVSATYDAETLRLGEVLEFPIEEVRSIPKLLRHLKGHCVNLKGGAKPIIAEALESDITEEARDILVARQHMSKSSLKKLVAMKDKQNKDGRIRGNHVYHKATTGRFAGSGVQIHNIPRPTISQEAINAYIKDGSMPEGVPVHEVCSSMLRSVIMGDKTFYCADFSGIELRVLLWLVEDANHIQMVEEGIDMYVVMASKIYGKKESEITKDQRALGKQAVLGCGYQMGAAKFKGTCESVGIELSDVAAKKAVNAYRDEFDLVKSFWYNAENTLVECVQNGRGANLAIPGTDIRCKYATKTDSLVVRLPSGRVISYANPNVDEDATTPWGSVSPKFEYYHPVYKMVTSTYGGSIVESIVQATACDFLCDAMQRLDNAGFKIVMHVHDEVVVEAEDDSRYDEFMEIMKGIPQWGTGCPIDAEGWKGKRYRK